MDADDRIASALAALNTAAPYPLRATDRTALVTLHVSPDDESMFWALTGLEERSPECVLVVAADVDGRSGNCTLLDREGRIAAHFPFYEGC